LLFVILKAKIMNIISSISELHRLLSVPGPCHPLVSIIDFSSIKPTNAEIWEQFFMNFYCISLKNEVKTKIKYGQQYYDFDKGTMNFTAPRQVQSISMSEIQEVTSECGKGFMLIFHPDLLRNHPLASTIKNYGFFSYALNEALHLSEREERNIVEIFNKIHIEYERIDQHTNDILLSQIDLILQYGNRFYQRQFITRRAVNNDLLLKVEILLNDHFNNAKQLQNGLPTVELLAEKLYLSANYLSDLLRSLTGMNTQQHIHEKIIEKAKEKLATTNLTVSEIATELGFEQGQSLNRIFKKKTNMSPLEYRKSFN
jgi:AraC-like DNA-binding protein